MGCISYASAGRSATPVSRDERRRTVEGSERGHTHAPHAEDRPVDPDAHPRDRTGRLLLIALCVDGAGVLAGEALVLLIAGTAVSVVYLVLLADLRRRRPEAARA